MERKVIEKKKISYNKNKKEFLDALDVIIHRLEKVEKDLFNWINAVAAIILSFLLGILANKLLSLKPFSAEELDSLVRILTGYHFESKCIGAIIGFILIFGGIGLILLLLWKIINFLVKKIANNLTNSFIEVQKKLNELYMARLSPDNKIITITYFEEGGIEFEIHSEKKHSGT